MHNCLIQNDSRIVDSRLFSAQIERRVVVINSTIEGSKLGNNCYINQSVVTEIQLEQDVVLTGNSNINRSIVGNNVIICPQAVVEKIKIEEKCYLDIGVHLIGTLGKYLDSHIVIKRETYLGPNVLIVGPIVIEHDSYIAAGVEIDAHKSGIIYIPPFSHVIKSNNEKGFEIVQNAAFYLCDSIWFTSIKSLEITEIEQTKGKIRLIQNECLRRNLNIKEFLGKEIAEIPNFEPTELFFNFEKLNQFLNRIMESLVN